VPDEESEGDLDLSSEQQGRTSPGGLHGEAFRRRRELLVKSRPPPPLKPVAAASGAGPNVCSFPQETVLGLPPAFSWGCVTCNDQMWLINTYAQGHGRDVFWPQVGASTVRELYGSGETPFSPLNSTPASAECSADFASGGGGMQDANIGPLFGLTKRADPFGLELGAYYGTNTGASNSNSLSNIVFSNGLLDPWSGAGVGVPTSLEANEDYDPADVSVQIGEDVSRDLWSVRLARGAHHLDLFFESPDDPPEAATARAFEEAAVRRWIGVKKRASSADLDELSRPPASISAAKVLVV